MNLKEEQIYWNGEKKLARSLADQAQTEDRRLICMDRIDYCEKMIATIPLSGGHNPQTHVAAVKDNEVQR